MNRFSSTIKYFYICLIFSVVSTAFSMDASAQNETVYKARIDSAEVLRKRYRNTEAWEYVVDAPGTLIYFPFKVVFKGTEKVVGFSEEYRLMTRLRELMVSDDGLKGVVPTYSSRSGGGAQLFLKDIHNIESRIKLTGTAGLRSRQQFELKIQHFKILDKRLSTDLLIRYRLMPDEEFFGIGTNTKKDERTVFSHEQSVAEMRIGSDTRNRFSFSIAAGFEINSVFNGKNPEYRSIYEDYNADILPGLESEIKLSRIELQLRHESRNSFRNTKSGSVSILRTGLYRSADHNNYGFWKGNLDYRRYVHLIYNRVMLLRFSGEITEELNGRVIPFYYLSELGTQTTIRGFRRGRIRARDRILASIEYRYPVWRETGDFMIFLDSGLVSDDIFTDFKTKDLKTGYGFGLSIWGEDSIAFQLVAAFSREGFRPYLVLNREF